MPRTENITSESTLNEFLGQVAKVNPLRDDILSIKEVIDSYMETIGTLLQENGGLDPYSFNIEGNPMIYTEALEIYRILDNISEGLEELQKNIKKKGKDHYQFELRTYRIKLYEEIKYYTEKISTYTNLIETEQSKDYPDMYNLQTYASKRRDSQAKLKIYQEKEEKLKARYAANNMAW